MKIVVVGAGIGGMLTAEKLGGLGFDVVVYEKANSLDEMRYDWHDDVSPVVFDVSWQSDPIVKRVIGVAGDTIEIKNDGLVYVNGVALEEDYIQGKTYTVDGVTPLKITVPEGHIFCLGDNREHSHDSRYSDIGTVSLDLVRGKCIFIVDRDGGLKTP